MVKVNYTYHAKLDRVIDGDTVVLVVDNGFHNREHHSFRLLDVDAPEIFRGDELEKQQGRNAKVLVENWFAAKANICIEGEEFDLIIVTKKDKQTFNRYIADVYCRGCDDHLNGYLRSLGYG